MASARDVFEFFCTNSSEKITSTLPFEDLNKDELDDLNSQSASVDLDCICYTNKTEILFSVENQSTDVGDDDFVNNQNPVDNLIGSNNPKFLAHCYFLKTYSSYLSGVFVVAEIGMYRIGRPKYLVQNSFFDDDSETDEEPTFTFQMTDDEMHKAINRSIEGLPTSYIPYKEFKTLIRRVFTNKELTIFCYGQKQPISTIAKNVVDLTSIGGLLDVALGSEFETGESFITTSYMNEYRESQFSNFLSNLSVNTQLKNKDVCNSKFNGAFRICVYNNLQQFTT